MKPKAILCVTNDLSGDQRVARTASALQELGWEVLLVGRIHSRTRNEIEIGFKNKRFSLPFEKGKWFYFAYNLRLFFFLLFSKVDLIWANDLDTLAPTFLVSTFRRKKLVYDAHELFTEVPELIHRQGTRNLWLKLESWILPKLTKMVTVNQSLANLYHEKYQIQVEVIRNVPFLRENSTPEVRDKNRLLYQGALNKGRGLELMIKAMAHLPGLQLHIAGTGDVEDELKALAKNGTLNQVYFHGQLSYEELKKLTSSAVLGLSLEEDLGANYRFSLPNKVFDYIQAGTPALVSDLPEMANLIHSHQTGWLIENANRNPQFLATKINMILNDETAWKQVQINCFSAAKELNWEKEKLKLESLL